MMRPLAVTAGVRHEKQARPLHHTVDPLVVHPRQPFDIGLAVQESSDPPVAVARSDVDQGPDARQQLGVAGLPYGDRGRLPPRFACSTSFERRPAAC
jgi:hypothetical protein